LVKRKKKTKKMILKEEITMKTKMRILKKESRKMMEKKT